MHRERTTLVERSVLGGSARMHTKPKQGSLVDPSITRSHPKSRVEAAVYRLLSEAQAARQPQDWRSHVEAEHRLYQSNVIERAARTLARLAHTAESKGRANERPPTPYASSIASSVPTSASATAVAHRGPPVHRAAPRAAWPNAEREATSNKHAHEPRQSQAAQQALRAPPTAVPFSQPMGSTVTLQPSLVARRQPPAAAPTPAPARPRAPRPPPPPIYKPGYHDPAPQPAYRWAAPQDPGIYRPPPRVPHEREKTLAPGSLQAGVGARNCIAPPEVWGGPYRVRRPDGPIRPFEQVRSHYVCCTCHMPHATCHMPHATCHTRRCICHGICMRTQHITQRRI